METLHQPIIKMEEDYSVCSDSDPDSAYISASWDWKSNTDNYSLSQTPSPQSLSSTTSFESFSACSQPPGMQGMAFGGEVAAYRLLPSSPDYQYHMTKEKGGHSRDGHGLEGTVSVQRRRKASEREKLRMRAIADALHTLRSNLPPIYSHGRQPLTKIQTLRCTISYIEEIRDLYIYITPWAPEPQETITPV
uniref:Mesogenin-1 n=1 Tax=Leptobrachium leishanense TaxID=445787 RepID=A0A8C5M487_9ANUR